jgi:hypothetical protein
MPFTGRTQWWRRQISRKRSTNLSVAEFCRQLGVHVTTFHYWKRRVEEIPPTIPVRASAERPSPEPTASVGTTVANFVPVSILDTGAGTQLEIELNNVCVVRLRGVVDPILLRAAIAAAGQVGSSDQGAN